VAVEALQHRVHAGVSAWGEGKDNADGVRAW
jgi:hypothetical protein